MENNNIELDMLRHSTSHVMAAAVKRIFGDVKVAIGPNIDNGFYYDFDIEKPFTPDDLVTITAEMKKIIKAKTPFVRKEITRAEALEIFKDEIYKTELINDLPENEIISIYELGDFVDLCRGPHLDHAGRIKAFKLMSVAGAYWRGNEKNKMLSRIYGTTFPTKDELNEYLEKIAEAERRDHRKLGRELDLFSIQEEAGAGLVFWHPKGAFIRKTIEDYWKSEHYKDGYELVVTPHIALKDLWATSGHLDFYSENMFSTIKIDEAEYMLKPMNCPFHLLIYKSKVRRYREMPIRWAEMGTVYRYEKSGVLHGLMRVRGFTQDDAHIMCTREQLDTEIQKIMKFIFKIFRKFNFVEYEIYLSTKPEKSVGSDEIWDEATLAIRNALESEGLNYKVDEGGGAFYGPKIDVKIKDAIGRMWQCSTVQIDFNEPERFDINYVAQDGEHKRPIMIHRALFGSLERFFGILIEHYAGNFPLWLAPTQIAICPITDKNTEYCNGILDTLRNEGFRPKIYAENEPLKAKIKTAELEKTSYMIIVGDRDMESNSISVRNRKDGDMGAMKVADFIEKLKSEL